MIPPDRIVFLAARHLFNSLAQYITLSCRDHMAFDTAAGGAASIERCQHGAYRYCHSDRNLSIQVNGTKWADTFQCLSIHCYLLKVIVVLREFLATTSNFILAVIFETCQAVIEQKQHFKIKKLPFTNHLHSTAQSLSAALLLHRLCPGSRRYCPSRKRCKTGSRFRGRTFHLSGSPLYHYKKHS